MIQLKRYTVAGIIFVWITGSLAHFLYAWTGNNSMAGLFTPVNDSVWEHMKLLFFPMLLYSFFISVIFKSSRLCIASSLLWGNLAGTLLIPVFYYAYTFILAKNIFILDIGIFILRNEVFKRIDRRAILSFYEISGQDIDIEQWTPFGNFFLLTKPEIYPVGYNTGFFVAPGQ